MKNLIFILGLCLMTGACAHRTVKVLDATWVSMRHSMPPSPKDKLEKVQNIYEEFCLNSWSGNFGMMDEVVKLAESKNKIDYIKFPSFTRTEGKSCVQVTGEGYRVIN